MADDSTIDQELEHNKLDRMYLKEIAMYNEDMSPSSYFLGTYNMMIKEELSNSFYISLTATYFALTTLSTIGFGDYHPI